MWQQICFMWLCFSQIYLSWKSGPAEVKHWKDMMGHPRTAVSQWHSLKAWGSQRSLCIQWLSTPASQPLPSAHIPYTPLTAAVSCLCSQASLISAALFVTPFFLNFTLSRFDSHLDLNVFDVFTHFIHVPLWELVVFFFQDTRHSFLHVKQS